MRSTSTILAATALAILFASCGYPSESDLTCPEPVCPQPICPQPPPPDCPYCPQNYPVERAVGGCDLDVACAWVSCDQPPRMCWTSYDCCGDTPLPQCAVRCLPFSCGGVCAVPLQ